MRPRHWPVKQTCFRKEVFSLVVMYQIVFGVRWSLVVNRLVSR